MCKFSEVLLFVVLFYVWLHEINAYHILHIGTDPNKSHLIVTRAVLHGLVTKGHKLTSYTVAPQSTTPANYSEIDIQPCYPHSKSLFSDIDDLIDLSPLKATQMSLKVAQVERLKNCESLVKLLRRSSASGKFDALIIEPFYLEIMAVFSHQFDIPLIYIFPNVPFPFLAERFGSSNNPAYIPVVSCRTAKVTSFVDRMRNTFVWFTCFLRNWCIQERADAVLNELLGPSVAPSLREIVSKASLILTNSHFSFTLAVPLTPSVVEIGGVQIQNTTRLPPDIEKFMDEAEYGVIYFSMGSIIDGKSFDVDKLNAFVKTFSRMPQRVLWKWEGEELPSRSANVMTLKWMAQRDILAHPNTKLFISHGGLMGSTEAIYESVPVLGIPIFGDQRKNVELLKMNRAAELLDYRDITEEVVFEKIWKLLNDHNAKEMSARFRDRPLSPLESAVYWIEYVIKNGGAHYLKSASVDLPWYQYFLLDIIAFSIVTVTLSLFALCFTCKIFLLKNSGQKPSA